MTHSFSSRSFVLSWCATAAIYLSECWDVSLCCVIYPRHSMHVGCELPRTTVQWNIGEQYISLNGCGGLRSLVLVGECADAVRSFTSGAQRQHQVGTGVSWSLLRQMSCVVVGGFQLAHASVPTGFCRPRAHCPFIRGRTCLRLWFKSTSSARPPS